MTPATPWTENTAPLTPYTEGIPPTTGTDLFALFIFEGGTSANVLTSYSEMTVPLTSSTEITNPQASWTEMSI